MPLAPTLLQEIDALLAGAGSDSQAIAALRASAPGVSASRCDWQDLQDEAPFRSFAAVDMFLVDGRDHCWRITDDPDCATGVVVTPKKPGAAS